MSWILPKLEKNEKFHSFQLDRNGRPIACVEVYVQESPPGNGWWQGHSRYKTVPFEDRK